jgi:hypothetical protein
LGLFKRNKREDPPAAESSEPVFQPTEEGRRFRQALLDGEFPLADSVLRSYADGEPGPPDPLMDQTAVAWSALDAERWDDAAEALQGYWPDGHPTHYCDDEPRFVECTAAYIAQGVGLVRFLSSPATAGHPMYPELLDDTFVPIVKGVRGASKPGFYGVPPVIVRVSFDDIYAQLKSAYELGRAGGA